MGLQRNLFIFLLLIFIVSITEENIYAEDVPKIIRINGTGAAFTGINIMANEFIKTYPDIKIIMTKPITGSRGGIVAVAADALDIGLSARHLKKEEIAKGLAELYYASTPYVFAVSKANKKIMSINMKEAVDIYAGRMTSYKDGSPIRLVLRPEDDADTKVLMDMSQEMAEAVKQALSKKGMITAVTDFDAADSIEKLEGAFGITTLSIIISEKRELRPLPLDGVSPFRGSEPEPAYPYYKNFYFVTKAKPLPHIQRFIDFANSKRGMKILKESGQTVRK